MFEESLFEHDRTWQHIQLVDLKNTMMEFTSVYILSAGFPVCSIHILKCFQFHAEKVGCQTLEANFASRSFSAAGPDGLALVTFALSSGLDGRQLLQRPRLSWCQ